MCPDSFKISALYKYFTYLLTYLITHSIAHMYNVYMYVTSHKTSLFQLFDAGAQNSPTMDSEGILSTQNSDFDIFVVVAHQL